jgi:hypothetical protein
MINYEKYEYSGWTLCKEAFEQLFILIRDKKLTNVLEFGSGVSTSFLKDLNINYVSFDGDSTYSAKEENVLIRPVRQATKEYYNSIIENKKSFNIEEFNKFPQILKEHTRQKYCFYSIEDNDLVNQPFDLILLDGPHGNGRSFAFNLIKSMLKKETYILVDDYNHYPFIDNLKIIFPKASLYFESVENCFCIYKVEI